MTNGGLMKVESIAECSPWSILQYFWTALSDNHSWKTFLVIIGRNVSLNHIKRHLKSVYFIKYIDSILEAAYFMIH